jgi:integrase
VLGHVPAALRQCLTALYSDRGRRRAAEGGGGRGQASVRAVYEHYRASLVRAFKAAGLDWPEGFRPCHDLRVTSATNKLLAGASKESLQVKLGHANFSTTQRYVNLAGVVFAEEAAALERRMNGVLGESSPDLSEPKSTSRHPAALSEAETNAAD